MARKMPNRMSKRAPKTARKLARKAEDLARLHRDMRQYFIEQKLRLARMSEPLPYEIVSPS